ncbi:hypothetical protein ACVIYL_008942 [Bradyrhizobium sp. USDA 3315]
MPGDAVRWDLAMDFVHNQLPTGHKLRVAGAQG